MKKITTQTNYRYSHIFDSAEYNVDIKCTNSTEAIINIQCAKGRGYSIGNAIRREILLNAESFAVCAIHISGINHEFASIKGVITPISEIISNLKQLIIVANSEYTVNDENKANILSATLSHDSTNGEFVVTGAQIIMPNNLQILNPSQEICRLDANSNITCEILITYGFGFLSSENIKYSPILPSEFIKLDVNFANDILVSIHLDENNRSMNTDFLTMNITSSLSHNVLTLYHKAIQSLMSLFGVLYDNSYLFQHNIKSVNDVKNYKNTNTDSQEILLQTLSHQGILQWRIFSALNKFGINTLRELSSLTEQQLLLIDGLGASAIEEIKKLLKEFKVELVYDGTAQNLGKSQINKSVMDENMIGSKNIHNL